MRLRSIEIGGYKSFGNRTELRFDGGLTAIVGPNGSGKSNIMDALRWVIGEGANRSLRVRRLDDVIFTGSAARAPSGLAEVRLRLDNEDGWLDLEAAEVEVQRRVHRDGESEFQLNGRSVRLREIQELFHNSGLGAGGYALMGQGLVDEVLRLRPIERRRLIEEVADVRRHRRKMIESRRQRERAEQHLERARMLRDELEPRLRTLERQARRERRRLEVETELGAALRAWYGAAAAQLADRERDRRAAAQAAEAEQRRAESERASAAEALAAAERAVEQAREAAEAAERGQRAAQSRLNDLRHAAELDDRRREWLSGEAANLESELGVAVADGDRQANLESDLERAEAAHGAAEARLREARKRRDQAQRERDEAARRQAAAAALAERLAAERAELRGDAQTLGAAWVAQLEALAAHEAARADAESEEAQAQTALSAAQADETRAAEQLERIEREQRELDEQRRAIEREIDDLGARIAALDDFASSDNGAAAGKSAPRLLSRLRVRDGYEAAVEAALGAVADAELQPSTAAALSRAQAALESGEAGWIGVAVELVHSRSGAVQRPRSAHRNGSAVSTAAVAVGLTAADVVDAPAELRPLVDALLGGVRIAEGVKQARALFADAPGDAPTAVVTRDGLLIRADGVVAARGRDGGSSAGRARQRRRVAEWRERRDQLERELEQLPRPDEQALAQARRDRERAASLTSEQVQAHARAAAALSVAAGARAAAQGELDRLRGDAFRIQSRLQRVRADAASLSPTEAVGRPAVAAPDADELAILEQERDAAAAARAEARARAERIERRAQAAARLEEARGELQALSDAQAERGAALAEAESAAADSGLLDAARAALQSAEQQRTDARERLDAAQSTRVEAERAAVEAQAALRETVAAQQRLGADAADDQIDLAALSPPEAQLPLDPSEDPAVAVEARRAAAVALRGRLQRLGPAQPEAAEEHESEQRRFTALAEQIADLEVTEARLREAERELERLIDSRFRGAFEKVDAAFQRYFRLMFRGGQARLTLSREDGPADGDPDLEPEAEDDAPPAGVDIAAQPPGKRVANLGQLSGGERALTAIALLFALLEIRPVPFCVLDEVDAALDEANVERFVQALKERAADIQFVVITHNRRTIEQADSIYGVTMASDGLSKVLSVRLDDLPAA